MDAAGRVHLRPRQDSPRPRQDPPRPRLDPPRPRLEPPPPRLVPPPGHQEPFHSPAHFDDAHVRRGDAVAEYLRKHHQDKPEAYRAGYQIGVEVGRQAALRQVQDRPIK